ncbi:MAG: DUF350 domain-containing protein [Dehalococcoidia bacterium]|nr:DUF350 domain-containing protein [Dehalococcoidia bacterium]
MEKLVLDLLIFVVFGVVGMGLLVLGFKIFDALIPFEIDREIFENRNMAAALTMSVFMVCLVVIIVVAML